MTLDAGPRCLSRPGGVIPSNRPDPPRIVPCTPDARTGTGLPDDRKRAPCGSGRCRTRPVSPRSIGTVDRRIESRSAWQVSVDRECKRNHRRVCVGHGGVSNTLPFGYVQTPPHGLDIAQALSAGHALIACDPQRQGLAVPERIARPGITRLSMRGGRRSRRTLRIRGSRRHGALAGSRCGGGSRR